MDKRRILAAVLTAVMLLGMLPAALAAEPQPTEAADELGITLLKTAATMAAFAGEAGVTRAHILAAAKMVLPHRMRRLPFETTDGLPSDLEAIIDA